MGGQEQRRKSMLIDVDDELLCRITIPGRDAIDVNLNAKNEHQVNQVLDILDKRNGVSDWYMSLLKISVIFMLMSPFSIFVPPLRVPTGLTLISIFAIEVALASWIRHLEMKAITAVINISVKTE